MTIICRGFSYLLFSAALFSGPLFAQKTIVDSVALAENSNVAKSNELYFEALKAKLHQDNKKAIELFEQFTLVNAYSAAAYYELAKLYDDDKKIDLAGNNIRKAIGLEKDNKWYSEEYANILSKEGKYEEAGKVIALIADEEISDPNYAAMAADYFDRAKKFDLAISYIDKAILRSGNDEDVMLRKMDIYLHMDEVEKAADVIRTLIANDPRNGRYYKLLGELYENNKKPQKALEVFQDAERKLPGEPSIDIGLSEHYLRLGDTANFRRYARKAITNDKLDAETQIQLFFAYIQGMGDSLQITEGMPILQKLLTQQPSNASLIAIYGEFLETAKRPNEAVVEYKKSLAIKPSSFAIWKDLLSAYAFTEVKNPDSLLKYSAKAMKLFPNQALAHYFSGLGYYNKKEYASAVKAVNRAVDVLPENDIRTLSVMYSFLGEIYHTTKQYDESDKAFEKALKYDPSDASVLNNYSYFLSERAKDLPKAKIMSEKSLKIRPNESTFLDTYGWILYKMGDYANAKTYIEKAVKASDRTSDGALYDHMGDICFRLNDKDGAIKNWKLAKEKGCDNPLLNKKISEEKLYE